MLQNIPRLVKLSKTKGALSSKFLSLEELVQTKNPTVALVRKA